MSNIMLHNQAQVVGAYQPDPHANYHHGTAVGADQFALMDILRIVERHRILLLAVVGVITTSTLLWQLMSPTVYRSTATIQVELIDDVGTNQADVLARNVQRIANEVKIYRSRAAAERVARALKAYDRKAVIEDLGRKPTGSNAEKIAQATSAIMRMVAVESADGSDLIDVSVTARAPKFSALVANQFPVAVQELKARKNAARREELLTSLGVERDKRAQQASEAAKRQVEFRLKNEMLVGAGGMEDLQQINRIASESASASAMRAGSAAQSSEVARAARIHTTAGATSPVLQVLEQQEAELSAEHARLSRTYGSGQSDMVRLNGQLAQVRENLARERSHAIAAATAVAGAEAARQTRMAEAEAKRDAARAGQLEGIVASLVQKANRNTTNTVELEQLDREAQQSAQAFNEIAQRIAQVSSQMMVEGVTSTIVSPAVANDNPIAPSPLNMTVLAFVGSSILGFLLVFARELLDDKLRTVAQVHRLFGLPTFGMLPMLSGGISKKLQESPVVSDPQSLFAEVARSTYAEVSSLLNRNKSQSVLITSPLPGDGKSVVALTLAVAAMVMGKRVAILDLDLRKASILQQVQQELNSPELLDVLKGHININQLSGPAEDINALPLAWVDQAEIDFSRFTLLSAMKPVAEPAALLNSGRMHKILEELKSKFDLIIVNAPATLAVRDARTMCEFTDNTVVVARWGWTTTDQMRATLELLGTENVAGVVFDQVDYAEHARRRYGDSIEFYFQAADYYSGTVPERRTLLGQLKRLFSRGPAHA